VGDPVFIPAAPLYVALDRGYFKEQGLDVSTIPNPGSTNVAQGIATNQMQFGILGPDPATFNGMDRGIETKIIASDVTNSKNDRPAAVLVRKDLVDSGAYKSPKDLKGKTIAIPAQLSQLYIERFLNSDGITTADVKLVNLQIPDQIPALQNKAIDASWEVEPLVTAAEKQNIAKSVATTGQLFPGAIAQALVMSPDFEKSNPEAAQRFVLAFMHGMRDYYHAMIKGDADKGPVIQALINHTAVKDPALYSVIGLSAVDPNGTMDAKSWDVFQDYFIKIGVQKTKIDLSKYIDMTLTNAAVDKLGREAFTPPPCC